MRLTSQARERTERFLLTVYLRTREVQRIERSGSETLPLEMLSVTRVADLLHKLRAHRVRQFYRREYSHSPAGDRDVVHRENRGPVVQR